MVNEVTDIREARVKRGARELLYLLSLPQVGTINAAHVFECGKSGSLRCTCGADDLNKRIQRCLSDLRQGA